MKARGFATGDSRPENYRAFPIPISGPMDTTQTDRVLLAGDAAGMVNAFSAEGIYFAMVSGDLAADAAIAALKANRFDARQLSSYQQAWEHEIGGELRHSVEIQRRLFTQPGRVDSLMRRAKSDPELLRLLCGYAMGFATYRAAPLAHGPRRHAPVGLGQSPLARRRLTPKTKRPGDVSLRARSYL